MKVLWLVGLLGLLLVAYDKVAGTTGEAPGPLGGLVAAQATVAIDDNGLSPARLSEYRLVHRALERDIPLHAMTAAFSCAK